MQIILWNDLKEGRDMKWSIAMNERNRAKVDIGREMAKTLAKVFHEDHGDD